jgi:hypothetical protein
MGVNRMRRKYSSNQIKKIRKKKEKSLKPELHNLNQNVIVQVTQSSHACAEKQALSYVLQSGVRRCRALLDLLHSCSMDCT